jgi:hypothetical protein
MFFLCRGSGNKAEILTKPYTGIIWKYGQKILGSTNPFGKILFKYPLFEVYHRRRFSDIPEQAHFYATFLLSSHDDIAPAAP